MMRGGGFSWDLFAGEGKGGKGHVRFAFGSDEAS